MYQRIKQLEVSKGMSLYFHGKQNDIIFSGLGHCPLHSTFIQYLSKRLNSAVLQLAPGNTMQQIFHRK